MKDPDKTDAKGMNNAMVKDFAQQDGALEIQDLQKVKIIFMINQ